MSALLALIVATTILAACGGGGSDEPDRTIGPPDCRNHPEQCE